MKKLAKRLYKTVRGFRKCLWGIPGVSGLGRNPDTNSMELLFWDGGSTYICGTSLSINEANTILFFFGYIDKTTIIYT